MLGFKRPDSAGRLVEQTCVAELGFVIVWKVAGF